MQDDHIYRIEVFPDEETGGYIAVVPQLLGCTGVGRTREEARDSAMTAIESWVEKAQNEGRHVPAPKGKRPFSSFY